MALTLSNSLRYEDCMAIETAGRDQSARSSLDRRAVLRRLIEAGEKLPATSRDEILALGPAAVPMLLEILGDEQLHLEDAPAHGWAPIHAVDLLGELRAPDAIEPLLRLLPKTNVDEIIHSRITRALESMGPMALEPMLRAYAENADRDCRSALSSVLAGLKVKDERVFSILVEELALEPGLGAASLAVYDDARALPALMRAFDQYEIDVDSDSPLANHDLTEIKAAIEGLGGELNELQQARYARAMKPAQAWRAKMREALASRERSSPPAASRQKLGRNDPCRCGSGKKYKKCCLTIDEQERAAARRVDESVDDAATEFFAQKARGRGPAQQMADFAQPLIDAGPGDLASLNKAMSLGMLFWNLAICEDDQRREEMLTDVMTNVMALGQDQADFRQLADDMIERHRTMFPEMHR